MAESTLGWFVVRKKYCPLAEKVRLISQANKTKVTTSYMYGENLFFPNSSFYFWSTLVAPYELVITQFPCKLLSSGSLLSIKEKNELVRPLDEKEQHTFVLPLWTHDWIFFCRNRKNTTKKQWGWIGCFFSYGFPVKSKTKESFLCFFYDQFLWTKRCYSNSIHRNGNPTLFLCFYYNPKGPKYWTSYLPSICLLLVSWFCITTVGNQQACNANARMQLSSVPFPNSHAAKAHINTRD